MLHKLQSVKRLIALCLVTLLVFTGTLMISPAPARADVEINNCLAACPTVNLDGTVNINLDGKGAALAAGVAVGTIIGSGSIDVLSAAGITSGVAVVGHLVATAASGAAVIGHVAATAAPLAAAAAPVVAAAAPIVVPVAATAAVGYGAYRLWENHHNNQS